MVEGKSAAQTVSITDVLSKQQDVFFSDVRIDHCYDKCTITISYS